jgi:hydrogenase expression/formation protein HypE
MPEFKIDLMTCPLPKMEYNTIQLAHGAGGKLSSELIDRIFIPRFGNKTLDKLEDQAILKIDKNRVAFTTDSFVVDPIFFPGGNIGDLSINGTINDIVMSGATPLYISVGFILEEGLPLETLHKIALSMEYAAKQANVQIVTGDTKVVNKGSCDKIFINTSGIGVLPDNINISATRLTPGDKVIVSGTVADHGMAIMMIREGLSFKSHIESDTAALNGLVKSMLSVSIDIHAMRDPTRGGVATTLNEFARQSKVGIQLYADAVPVKSEVKGACEVLGIDPLYVANEGKLVTVVPAEIADKMVQKMKNHKLGKDTKIIGEVTDKNPGLVVQQTGLGANRIVDMPIGEQLPRIC